jgi:FkbM family methyltransferase
MTKTLLPILKRIINVLPFGRFTLYRYISKINFGEFIYSARSSNSFKFICNIKDPISRAVFFSDAIEPQFISIIENNLKQGMSFVDVGASWGYYSMLASKIVGDMGSVIALEPDIRYLNLLKKNIELNAIHNTVICNVAAGQEDGFIYMESQEKSNDAPWEIPRATINAEDPLKLNAIECRKLDDILGTFFIGASNDKISFLKMNIEGAEYEALKGMTEGLKNMRYERMLIEFHPPWLEEREVNTEILVNQILSYGYKGWWIQRSRADIRKLMYSNYLPSPKDFLLEMRDGIPPVQDVWPCAYFIAKDNGVN